MSDGSDRQTYKTITHVDGERGLLGSMANCYLSVHLQNSPKLDNPMQISLLHNILGLAPFIISSSLSASDIFL